MNFYNPSNELLSKIVSFRTYAKYLKHLQRRESLEETINRSMNMHLDRFPKLSRDIIKAFQKVHELKIMPAGRSLQFAGDALIKTQTRQFNCSYLPINDPRCFGESMFLLLSGCGVGYSVQKHHTNNLPKVQKPVEEGAFIIQDSITGWAQSVDMLMEAYFYGKVRPIFDFSNIRPKGSNLVTIGSKAPGPEPLRQMLGQVERKLIKCIGRKLTTLEVHDLVCMISDCVVSGGSRRSALLALFDRDDQEMIKCKTGSWWEKHPYRSRANNSAVLPRQEVTKEEFDSIYSSCKESGSGEPGFSWSNNKDWGFNPSLRAGTKVWTKEFGMVPIEQLEGKTFQVKNLFGELSEARCWKSGTDVNLIRVSLSNGSSYYASPQHKWPVIGEDGRTIYKTATIDLLPGVKIPRLPYQKDISSGTLGTYKEGACIGFLYMIGKFNLGKVINAKKYILPVSKVIYSHKNYIKEFESIFAHKLDYYSYVLFVGRQEIEELLEKFGASEGPKKGIPTKIWTECSNEFIDGFIKGVFDAKLADKQHEKHKLSFRKTKVKFIKEFKELCGFKGIYFRENKNENDEILSLENRTLQINNTEVVIKNVARTNLREDVWDISVNDKSHCFQLADCITGNCHEVSLKPYNFCNLVTINQTGIKDKKDFLDRIYSATLIATLQATYTDFYYLRPIWKATSEEEALIGVSFTGIADSNDLITSEWLQEGAKHVLEINEKYAKKLGINIAARTTCEKPEGTLSLVFGSSSGIHARHSPFYLRRIRMDKQDALAQYLKNKVPDLVEDDKFSASGVVVTIPQESPDHAIIREKETALSLLDRALKYNVNWVIPGHRSGDNYNNVSTTISVREDEWDILKEEMWKNRDKYTGISLLPYSDHTYEQEPFKECSKEEFNSLSKLVKNIDLKEVLEEDDFTTRIEQAACVGGVCSLE